MDKDNHELIEEIEYDIEVTKARIEKLSRFIVWACEDMESRLNIIKMASNELNHRLNFLNNLLGRR